MTIKEPTNEAERLLAWEQEFQEVYIDTLIAGLEYATKHGSAGQAVEAHAELQAFHKYLEAKAKFLRTKLENHMLDGLETVIKRFPQTSELP